MNTNKKKNKELNTIFINIGIIILLILLIIIIFFSLLAWQKTRELLCIVIGFIYSIGTIFNIYLLLKEKY